MAPWLHWSAPGYLNDLNDNPELLIEKGYRRVDQHTTDPVRLVWFVRDIESFNNDIELSIKVEFELAISDNPYASDRDNYDYMYNQVFLEASSINTGDESEYLLSISTIEDLERFCRSIE